MVDPPDTSGVKIEESKEKKSPTRFQKKKHSGKHQWRCMRTTQRSRIFCC